MKCSECIHFKQIPSEQAVGHCMRYPRVAGLEGDDPKWLYPVQFAEGDWCGEWDNGQKKPKE